MMRLRALVVVVGSVVAVLVIGTAALASAGESEGVDFASVDLGGVFGQASASARQLTAATIELNLKVEADSNASVVVHLIEPGGGQNTIPLVSLNEGSFGVIVEVRRVDYVVVFESLAPTLSSQSQPRRLTELGVEPAVLGIITSSVTTTSGGYSTLTRQWGWAALGLAALALGALALWALPGRRRVEELGSETTPDEVRIGE